MKRNNRAGGGKGGDGKKQKNISDFLSPASPSVSMSSPPSPSVSMSSPPSPSVSMSSPPSPSSSLSSMNVSAKNVCSFCIPPVTFPNQKACTNHDRTHHAEENGFYAPKMTRDRQQTRALFDRYLPVLPNGITTLETPLGIYLHNAEGQTIGAFHIVVSDKSVTAGESGKVRSRVKLFPYSGYAQGHIIPGSSARDDMAMYELTYDARNFEPINPNMNAFVGGKIEDYGQRLVNDWKWEVCVFILLDKRNPLGTITATNGSTYTISSQWSYLFVMKRGEEHFYEAFTFPNEEPTMSYGQYRTTIAQIRSLSDLNFQFEMSESISQHWYRVKKEKYERDNPFLCSRSDLGCYKRFASSEQLRDHGRCHNPVRQRKNAEDSARRRAATRTSVIPASPSADNSS